jgi:hypothetical protein
MATTKRYSPWIIVAIVAVAIVCFFAISFFSVKA